jgi:branched-chain amino acid aminotransferase
LPYLNYNGTIFRDDKKIIKADNRGLRYGDGLFETMRMVKGVIPLAALHFDRLMNGIALMQFDKPPYFTAGYLTGQIRELAEKNNHNDEVRVRLMIFRGEGGLYDAQNNFTNYIIQTWSLPGKMALNENGLVIDIFPDARIAADCFSHLKSNNYLPYLMGAMYVKKNQLNDCLLLNTSNNICDATIANVFIIKQDRIYTPPLAEGCVEGVTRKYLLEQLPANKFTITEKVIAVADLLNADEVFLSNAIYGIKWVRQFRESQFGQQLTGRIFDTIIRKIF